MRSRDKYRIAVLSAYALALHGFESLIPLPIPWLKVGLANIITITTFILLGFRDALSVTLIRVTVASFITGSFLGPRFVLSLSGGLSSIVAMGLTARLVPRLFSSVGLSLIGALFHNLAQLFVAHLFFIHSVHAKVRGDKPLTCQGCHGPVHYTPRSRDPSAPMSAVNQLRNCGQCHKDMMEGYLGSVHARALLVSGLNSAPACSDCHGNHDILRHTDPDARSSHEKSPETCGSCHEGILKVWEDSAHGALWKEGKDGPVCATCHSAHSVKDPTTLQSHEDMPHECGTCHDELLKTFHDSFHGKALSVGRKQAATCSDCHTPHQNLPANDPRSTIHADNLAKTCGTAAFLAGAEEKAAHQFILDERIADVVLTRAQPDISETTNWRVAEKRIIYRALTPFRTEV